MRLLKLSGIAVVVAGLIVIAAQALSAESAKVIILGSGTPIPDPSSSGPCVAVVVNGQAYLFDAGPGVVRQAEAAAEKFGIGALDATHLTRLFVTHLHSDHTLGYPDLILTPWVVGRQPAAGGLRPPGNRGDDRPSEAGLCGGYQGPDRRAGRPGSAGLTINVHEIAAAGLVYKDANVTVRAIAVKHGSWAQAFGYAIDARRPHDCHFRRYRAQRSNRRGLSRVRRLGSRSVFGGPFRTGVRTTAWPVPSEFPHIDPAISRTGLASEAETPGAVSPTLFWTAARSRPGERNPSDILRKCCQRSRSNRVLREAVPGGLRQDLPCMNCLQLF